MSFTTDLHKEEHQTHLPSDHNLAVLIRYCYCHVHEWVYHISTGSVGLGYLFTLVLHVVRSCERPSDRSIPLVAAFLTGFLLTHERTLCVLLRKAKQRHFHGRPILYRAFPPSDTLWYVLFSLALLCSNIIKDSKHAGFCSKH